MMTIWNVRNPNVCELSYALVDYPKFHCEVARANIYRLEKQIRMVSTHF